MSRKRLPSVVPEVRALGAHPGAVEADRLQHARELRVDRARPELESSPARAARSSRRLNPAICRILGAGQIAPLEDQDSRDCRRDGDRRASPPRRPDGTAAAGTSPMWWNGERSSTHDGAPTIDAEELPDERERGEPVRDARRSREAATANASIPMPRKSSAAGRQFAPAPSMPAERHVRALRRRARPGAARRRAARAPHAAAAASTMRPASHRRRPTGSANSVSSSCSASSRRVAATCEQREEADREDEEEERQRRGSPTASRSTRARASRARCCSDFEMSAAEMLFEITPRTNANAADAEHPGGEDAALGAKRLRGRRAEQPVARRRAVVRVEEPGADVAAQRDRPARGRAARRSPRAGAAGPPAAATRTRAAPRPSRAASPSAAPRAWTTCPRRRGGRTRRRARRCRGRARVAVVGASWLATRADADEDRHDRDDGEREIRGAAGGQPRDDEAGERREPQHDRAGGDRGERRDERALPADRAGEHELLPARVLLRRASRAPRRALPRRRRRSRASRRRATPCSRRRSAGRAARRRRAGCSCWRRSRPRS